MRYWTSPCARASRLRVMSSARRPSASASEKTEDRPDTEREPLDELATGHAGASVRVTSARKREATGKPLVRGEEEEVRARRARAATSGSRPWPGARPAPRRRATAARTRRSRPPRAALRRGSTRRSTAARGTTRSRIPARSIPAIVRASDGTSSGAVSRSLTSRIDPASTSSRSSIDLASSNAHGDTRPGA